MVPGYYREEHRIEKEQASVAQQKMRRRAEKDLDELERATESPQVQRRRKRFKRDDTRF